MKENNIVFYKCFSFILQESDDFYGDTFDIILKGPHVYSVVDSFSYWPNDYWGETVDDIACFGKLSDMLDEASDEYIKELKKL